MDIRTKETTIEVSHPAVKGSHVYIEDSPASSYGIVAKIIQFDGVVSIRKTREGSVTVLQILVSPFGDETEYDDTPQYFKDAEIIYEHRGERGQHSYDSYKKYHAE